MRYCFIFETVPQYIIRLADLPACHLHSLPLYFFIATEESNKSATFVSVFKKNEIPRRDGEKRPSNVPRQLNNSGNKHVQNCKNRFLLKLLNIFASLWQTRAF